MARQKSKELIEWRNKVGQRCRITVDKPIKYKEEYHIGKNRYRVGSFEYESPYTMYGMAWAENGYFQDNNGKIYKK